MSDMRVACPAVGEFVFTYSLVAVLLYALNLKPILPVVVGV